VQCFWYWALTEPLAHTYERLLPNGEPAIIFNLQDDAIRSMARTIWLAIALDCGYYDQAHFVHDSGPFPA
jgi:hypothetical protein